MASSAPNVLGFLLAADRNICLRAISRALLKVRAIDGITCEKLGVVLECSAETIRNASNEDAMLSFDAIVRLCQSFPDESAPIRELLECHAVEQPTFTDRLERIERELDAIRREAA